MNIRVEYEIPEIRHLAIQCPVCKTWFCGYDLSDKIFVHVYNLANEDLYCPICENSFNTSDYGKIEVEERDYPEVYEGCIKKKVTWE